MPQAARQGSPIGEDRIREAFEYAAAGMAITDLDGHFQETNPAYERILDRTEEQLRHETVLSVTHPEDRDNCQQHLNALLSGTIPSFVIEKALCSPLRGVGLGPELVLAALRRTQHPDPHDPHLRRHHRAPPRRAPPPRDREARHRRSVDLVYRPRDQRPHRSGDEPALPRA